MNKGKRIDSREVAFSDVEKLYVSLMEETLSDGSKAYNVYVMFPGKDEVVHYAEDLKSAQASFLAVIKAFDNFIVY